MKKVMFLISLSLMLTQISKAQDAESSTSKGGIFLGTTTSFGGTFSNVILSPNNGIGIGFTTQKSKDANGDVISERKITSLNFAPQIGYFVTDGLVGGVIMDFWYLKTENEMFDGTDKFTLFAVGPFLRYYFPISNEKLKPFIHVQTAWGNTKDSYKSPSFDNEFKQSISTYGANAGVAVFLNPHITFDIQATFEAFTISDETDDENSEKSFGLRAGFGFFF